jgi:hypothetical protein
LIDRTAKIDRAAEKEFELAEVRIAFMGEGHAGRVNVRHSPLNEAARGATPAAARRQPIRALCVMDAGPCWTLRPMLENENSGPEAAQLLPLELAG